MFLAEGWEVRDGGDQLFSVTFCSRAGEEVTLSIPGRVCAQLAAALDPEGERHRPREIPAGELKRSLWHRYLDRLTG